MTTIMTSLLNVLKFPERLSRSGSDEVIVWRATYEKFALDDPRLKPTVPYALTISKMTLKILNHGSSALPMTRLRCIVSQGVVFFTHFDDTDEPKR